MQKRAKLRLGGTRNTLLGDGTAALLAWIFVSVCGSAHEKLLAAMWTNTTSAVCLRTSGELKMAQNSPYLLVAHGQPKCSY